ncbi:MAG: chalcone isomerase family protein [Pseudomonadota bacterium]
MVTRARFVLLLFALLLALSRAALAQVERAGVTLPERLDAGGQQFDLVACGVRDTLWITHYVSAIYVPPGAAPVQAVSDPSWAKLVRVVIVNGTWLPDDIPEEYREPLREDLARDPFGLFQRYYQNLAAGDVINALYLPGRGVALSVNGRMVATEPGHDLIEELMKAWSEADPVTKRLHRLIMNNPC